MKTAYLLFLTLVMVVSVGFLVPEARADDANGMSIPNISVQPYAVKVGDILTVTATLVNNSTVPIFVSDMINNDCQGPFFTVSFDNHVKVAAAADNGRTCSYVGLQKRLDPGEKYTGTSPGLFFTYIATQSGTANVTVTFPYEIKNQTDPTQSNLGQTISKSFSFTILDNNTETKTVTQTALSPLKQFKSGIAAKDVKCHDDLLLTFKAEDGSPACVNPETAKKLYERGWALALTINVVNNTSNQTLVIGTDAYDVREFPPIPGNTVYLDDMKFVYEGRSPLNNSCYPDLVNQTQARDFEIVSNETDMNAHFCWPPTNYPQNMTKQNVLPSDLFLKYSIGFFDNQTMGVGWCHVDSCEFGKMFFLVKKGWNTPLAYDSVSNLEFHLITNASTISAGQAIGINMSTINKSPNTILVPNKYNFSFNGTGLGLCNYGPFRLAIFNGYYDENNLTHGTELQLYKSGMYTCAAPSPAKGYKFESDSNTSTPRCSPFSWCGWVQQMQEHVYFSGYWTDTNFHEFGNGAYTIIAGDEWSNHSIKHFTVNSAGPPH